MKRFAFLFALAFGLTTTAQAQLGSAPTNGSPADATNLTMTSYNQGIFSGALQSASSQDVDLNIVEYVHVQLLDESTASISVAPGGSGSNQVRVDNDLRYATNYAPGTAQVLVDVTGAQADFDELNFLVRTRLFGSNTVTVEDIATGGSAGDLALPWPGVFEWNYGNSSTKAPTVFADNFGQVVAVAPIRYDITVSDVALEGDRDFTVDFTITP